MKILGIICFFLCNLPKSPAAELNRSVIKVSNQEIELALMDLNPKEENKNLESVDQYQLFNLYDPKRNPAAIIDIKIPLIWYSESF